MAVTETVHVTVYRAGIQSHFQPGGGVAVNGIKVATQAVLIAKRKAPRRTGRLADSIRHNGGIMGSLSYLITIQSVGVPYARFVMEGTKTPIVPRTRTFLKVPLESGNGYAFKRKVRGQPKNPFLSRAVSDALRANGYAVSFG